MVKKIAVSFSNWVFNTYLFDYKGNRSKFIEEMLIKGIEVETGEFETTKQKILLLSKENRNLENETSKQKTEIARLNKIVSSNPLKYDPDKIKKKQLADGIIKSGALADLGE